MTKIYNIEDICNTESFKTAHSDYGIDYKTYMSFRPDLVESAKCSDEFVAHVNEAIRKQEIYDANKKAERKQKYQEEKATAMMLKSLVEQMTKRSKFFTND